MLFGKQVNRYYFKYLPLILLGIFALIMVDFFQLEIPKLYRNVVNGVNGGTVTVNGEAVPFNIEYLLEEVCRPLLVIIVALVFGRFLWRVTLFGTGIRVETDLRSRMFRHCEKLSPQFYQTSKTGNLMSLFTNDLDTVQECFGDGILMFFDALFLGILALYNMIVVNPTLTLLSMIPLGFMLASSLIIGKYLTIRWDKRQAAFSSLSDFSQESFAGIAVIKAFVKEAKELLSFKKLNKQNEDTNIAYTRLSVGLRIAIIFFIESVFCIILGYGGYLVHEDVLNAGQLVEFMGYFEAVIWPVMAISRLIEFSSKGKASLKRINALLETESNVKDKDGVSDIAEIKGKIEFRSLTFRYPDAEFDALKNTSFEIKAGESVGIIGKTGCGKTTLVELILRLYNVPSGTLFIDGYDVNDIPIRTVRKHVSYVPQDNFLFSDTIENNISFATDDKNDEITQFAKYADIHDSITSFPSGYKTFLGERGVTISGGQKQRISIARALMKDSPILILDDAVSSVDVKTEKSILSHLREVRQGKTTVLISHRVSTVKDMDKIVYLEEGSVLAVGSYDELYSKCEEFKSMVQLQSLVSEKSANEASEDSEVVSNA